MDFDVISARSQFPALRRTLDGVPVIYADGPGGTQVPESVIGAMCGYMERGGSNLGGPFATSVETATLVSDARAAVADLYNADSPDEIVFGQNMTSLTLAMGRALARTWAPGDEVVVTRLDHDANVSTWTQAAREADAVVRFVEFDPADGVLEPDVFDPVLNERTRLVAVTHASNAIGTVVDVASVTERAHAAGALVYVDAVHYTPHGPVDVRATDCDFLVASAYKFFGPHTGALYGKRDLLAQIEAVKIRPAPSDPPGKWETGTQSFESIAGVAAAVEYLARLGTGNGRRDRLVTAMDSIRDYESALSERFLSGIEGIPSVRLYGVRSPVGRTPTFAVAVEGMAPAQVAAELGAGGVFVWHGHYYALEVMRHLGVADGGGLVRIGFVHYNTLEEVDRVLGLLATLA